MRVDANALRRTSKVFGAMLFGPFIESKRTADWTVKLPEDDPEALQVIFNAAHAENSKVPPELELSKFYRITVMADKYRMVGLLRPWASTWTSTINTKDVRGVYRDGTTYEDLQRLCVLYYSGTAQQLKEILVTLIFQTKTNPEGRLIFGVKTDTDEDDSEKQTREWEAFVPLPQSMIGEALPTIVKAAG